MRALLLAAVMLGAPLRAATFESGDRQTTLVELYTSEGCSSCPPAEERLAELRDDPGLWKAVVPIAFHVDYWDGLGWPDRFARPEFTLRQRAYGARWKEKTIYTPAFVQNGREGRVSTPASEPGRLRAEVDSSGEILVTFRPSPPTADPLVVESRRGAWTAQVPLPQKTVASISALAVWVHTANDPTPLRAPAGGWKNSLPPA